MGVRGGGPPAMTTCLHDLHLPLALLASTNWKDSASNLIAEQMVGVQFVNLSF